jgi:hypothetical protein
MKAIDLSNALGITDPWECHKRMGDIDEPDRALSLAVLHQIILNLEEDWLKSCQTERYKFAREACFYLIAFCGALRGEEVPMANLTGTLKHWEAGGMADPPHVPITLLDRLKGSWENNIIECLSLQ